MINIISHRGFWNNQIKKNSFESFNKSLSLGFGIETDFRDFNGGLVISHDVPKNDFIDSDRFFKLLSSYKNSLPVAINIKSDGLQDLLMSYLRYLI